MLKENKKIICAGLYRSGSTWLFNVVRAIFEFNNIEYQSGFGVYNNDSPVQIIKLHSFQPEILSGNVTTIMTVRDLRDIIASAIRKYGKLHINEEFCLKKTFEFADEVLKCYYDWREHTDLFLKYENIVTDKKFVIQKISQTLKQPVDIEQIHEYVENLKMPTRGSDADTLLWANHITDGSIGSFKKTLNPHWISAIEEKYHQFIKDYKTIISK